MIPEDKNQIGSIILLAIMKHVDLGLRLVQTQKRELSQI